MAVYAKHAPEDSAPLLQLRPVPWGNQSRSYLLRWAVETMKSHHMH